jgi:predicted RNA-binding Zn-ribbon protein involved in translation (DUF1610 family)
MDMHPKLRARCDTYFGARRPRERSACPKCESVHIKKRVRTHDYICNACGWEGVTVKKVIW